MKYILPDTLNMIKKLYWLQANLLLVRFFWVTGEIVFQGAEDLYEHLRNLKNTNVTIFFSCLSSKARGYE